MSETLLDDQTDTQRERVKAFFDADRDWQGEYYGTGSAYFARLLRRRKDLVMQSIYQITRSTRATALDIGCGSGIYTEELLRRGYETTGMDLSEEMIEACRRRFNGMPIFAPALHLQVGDIESLPFPDAHFDLVLCIGVLGYLIDDERALKEITRVVQPGGHVVINVTNAFGLSDLDTRLRAVVRSWFAPKSKAGAALPSLPYAIRSAWMEKNRQYANKSYRLDRFEQLLASHGLVHQTSLTFGFEFRLLRRFHLLPVKMLDVLELAMERLFMKFRIPYFSRSGWGYVGVFSRTR